MPNTLNNPSLERHLRTEEITVDAHHVVTCHLVARCEGVIARFTVRDDSSIPMAVIGERRGTFTTATMHLQRHYGLGMMSATAMLAHTEQLAWRRLHDMGYDVPADFYGE